VEARRRRDERQAEIAAQMQAAVDRANGRALYVLWRGVIGRGLPLAALALAAVALVGLRAPGPPAWWGWVPAPVAWAAVLAPGGAAAGALWGLWAWRRMNRRWPPQPGEWPPPEFWDPDASPPAT
jgi:hypothetical protein